MGKKRQGKDGSEDKVDKTATKAASKAAEKAAGNAVKEAKARRKSGNAARMGKGEYVEKLAPLQIRLNDLARWLQQSGKRLAVVVEGRDTAGKGGVIAAIAETLNPRQCHVVALDKPSDRERSQWYFQRYVPHLPAAGEIVLFDRSWYNRAGVERVMGFCSEEQARAFLEQAPVFERMLVGDGVLLLKYWLTVDQAEQEVRFAERLADPLKRWKLSPIDVQAREKYADYGRARDAMLKATHTPQAPWTLVDFNDQRRGRLALIEHLLAALPVAAVPETLVEFPPLGHEPLQERYMADLKPI